MPGRPSRRNEETQTDAPRTRGVIPAGAFAMLFAITGVFAYGIYLKAAGPSESVVDAPSRPAAPASAAPAPPAGARPSASPAAPAPDAGLPTQSARGYRAEPLGADAPGNPADLPPVIPEAATAGTLATPAFGGGASASAPRTNPSSPPSARPSAPTSVTPSAPGSAPASSSSPPPAGTSAPLAGARTSPPAPRAAAPGAAVQAPRVSPQASRPGSPPVKARHEEPPDSSARDGISGAPRTTPEAPAAASAPPGSDEAVSRLAAAPRGAAPAVALRRAHEELGAKRYKEAARSWNDWAAKAPAGSWTVQIAAIRLDKPASAGKLDGIAGREGAFVLPSGTLPGGLAPVCVGVYPSEEAARRAAASMAPFPGSSNKPIPKPLSSLSH